MSKIARQNGWRRNTNRQNRMYWIALALLTELTGDTWHEWNMRLEGNYASACEELSGYVNRSNAYVNASIYDALWHKDRTSISTIL